MRKPRKLTFQELVSENKKRLMEDKEALKKIEERLEKKYLEKAQ
ncbi:MAG: FbpB family small basic protein [Bacillales bacterium]